MSGPLMTKGKENIKTPTAAVVVVVVVMEVRIILQHSELRCRRVVRSTIVWVYIMSEG